MALRDDLLAEIRRDPAADDVRQVYADALLSEGDPHGELIAQQLAPHPDPDRIEALIAAHGLAWLGGLRELGGSARFHRGFVSMLELTEVVPTQHQLAEPALATVEDLLIGTAAPEVYVQVLTSPAMSALRRIVVDIESDPMIEALPRAPARIDHVSCAGLPHRRAPARWSSVLASLARRPTLTSLGIEEWMLPDLIASPLLAQLRSITIARSIEDGMRRWPVGGRRIAVVFQKAPELDSYVGPQDRWSDGAVEIVPVGDGAMARVWGSWGLSYVPDVFQRLPPDVTRVEIEGEPHDLDRTRRTAALLGIEVGWSPPRRRHAGHLRWVLTGGEATTSVRYDHGTRRWVAASQSRR